MWTKLPGAADARPSGGPDEGPSASGLRGTFEGVIAKVEPLTPARALRGPFDYLVPTGMEGVEVGSMLVVPFGRRRLLGVVVALAEHSDVPPERLVEPLQALGKGVPAELVRLGLWVAEEYCSTPARGLALVLPPGTGTGSGRRVGIRRALVAELTDAGRAALGGEAAAGRGARGGEAAAGGGAGAAGRAAGTPGPRLGERQRAALQALAEGPLPAASIA